MKRVSVEVTGISVCAPYQGYVVILKEKDGQRLLPIFIGPAEAHNISLLLQGLKFVRPLTYDLFQNLLDTAGAHIRNITVTDLKDNTFFAQVSLNAPDGKLHGVDARPSDAIALAIKTKVPIFVNSKVMDDAGLVGSGRSREHDTSARIQVLTQQLNYAVEQEAYEDAARLRDQIRDLEGRKIKDLDEKDKSN